VLHGGRGIEFSDHTDIRPTLMALLGLEDDYVHDGRVLVEALNPAALPSSLVVHRGTLIRLGQAYKQINAPFGGLGQGSLVVSTAALETNSAGDQVYTNLENKIAGWHARRDSIAGQMKAMLEDAAFNGQPIAVPQAQKLISQAQALLNEVDSCRQNLTACQAQ
jgi:hypothetical protein